MAAKKDQEPTDDQQEADQEVQSDPEGVAEADNAQVQEKVDEETEKGYRGSVPDPTPNENYTLAGQNAGKPTPETDEDAREEARKAITEVAAAAKGVG